MFSRFHLVHMVLLVVAVLLLGCAPTPTPTAPPTAKPRPGWWPSGTKEADVAEGEEKTLNITVSILPQKYLVERVGGEYVKVSVMVLPGNSPATYEPKPEQLKALSEADAYISIGVPFEKAWLDKITAANDKMLMVDTTQGIERRPMSAHRHEGEGHGEKEGGHEDTLDPHIWLSPRLVKVQVYTTAYALIDLDPEHATVFEANTERLLDDIDTLDADIRETLANLKSRQFIVFHPSWGYFAEDYGLEMIPIEIGGQEPSAKELAELITEAKEGGIRVVFAQPEFSTKAAETIAKEIGGEVLLISPLNPDWLGNLRNVADTFADALGE